MVTKLKKALKKALIKIYSESKKTDLRLESSLKSDLVKSDCIYSSHLTGSNKAQLISILKLGIQTIKLPAILKVFSLSHDFKLLMASQKHSFGTKAFVIHKVDNLTFKIKKYKSVFKACSEFCTKIKAIINIPLSKCIFF